MNKTIDLPIKCVFYALTIGINFSKDYYINEAVFSGLPI